MLVRRAVLSTALAAGVLPTTAHGRQGQGPIDAAAWLAGRWVGGGPMGQAECSWSPPVAGQMVGHFTLYNATRIIFYELLVLDVQEGGLRMSAKHFAANLRPWEPGDQWQHFEPRSSTPDELRFDGVIIRRLGPDRHSATVTHVDARGVEADTVFTYTRAPL